MVQFGSEVREWASGRTEKKATCESCNHAYHYQIEREGVGEGFSWFFLQRKKAKNEANDRARRDLVKRLRVGVDLVPCPRCGHCQADMVRAEREKQHGWMTVPIVIAAVIFLYTLPLSLAGQGKIPVRDRVVIGYIAAAAGTLAFGFAFMQSHLRKRYDPNSIPLADRLEISRSRCSNERFQSGIATVDDRELITTQLAQVHSNDTVSSSDQHNGVVFLWHAAVAAVLGFILLESLPNGQKWRVLAAFAMSGLFLLFSVKFFKRRS